MARGPRLRKKTETVAERFLRILPTPPRNDLDEGTAEIWMRNCARIGGAKALDWLWQPENWPLGTYMRARMFHIHGELHRELEEKAKQEAQEAAQQAAGRVQDAQHAARRKVGWAP